MCFSIVHAGIMARRRSHARGLHPSATALQAYASCLLSLCKAYNEYTRLVRQRLHGSAVSTSRRRISSTHLGARASTSRMHMFVRALQRCNSMFRGHGHGVRDTCLARHHPSRLQTASKPVHAHYARPWRMSGAHDRDAGRRQTHADNWMMPDARCSSLVTASRLDGCPAFAWPLSIFLSMRQLSGIVPRIAPSHLF